MISVREIPHDFPPSSSFIFMVLNFLQVYILISDFNVPYTRNPPEYYFTLSYICKIIRTYSTVI